MTLSTVLTWRTLDEHPDVRRAQQALAEADLALQQATESAHAAEQDRHAVELDAALRGVDERRLTTALDAEQLAQSRLRTARHRVTAAQSALEEARQLARRAVVDHLASTHTSTARDFDRQLAQACTTSRHLAALEDAALRLGGKSLPALAMRREFGTGPENRYDTWRKSREAHALTRG